MRNHRRRSRSAVFLVLALPVNFDALPTQKPKDVPARPPALTEEERQILKDREMLENLELLQNLEKIRLLELFTEGKKPTRGQTGSGKPAGKNNGSQKKRE